MSHAAVPLLKAAPPREGEKAAAKKDVAGKRLTTPAQLDLRKLAEHEPEPPAEVVSGVSCGEATLIAANGGDGKSTIALTLGACVATGKAFFGLPTSKRRTAFLSLEDPGRVLHWRLKHICASMGIAMSDLAGQLTLWDGSETPGALMAEDLDGLRATPLLGWLVEHMAGVEFLIIDGISDAFDGNENRRSLVRKFVREMRSLVPADGAVVLIAHVDKATARSPTTAQGYSGSTAWSNSVRSRWYLRRDETDRDLLLLEVQKANYSRAGLSLRVRWSDEMHTFVSDGSLPVTKLDRALAEADDREALLQLIRAADLACYPVPAATGGMRTCWHVLAAMPGCPESMRRPKEGRRRMLEAIETLRAAKAIRVEAIRTASRNSREVLRAA